MSPPASASGGGGASEHTKSANQGCGGDDAGNCLPAPSTPPRLAPSTTTSTPAGNDNISAAAAPVAAAAAAFLPSPDISSAPDEVPYAALETVEVAEDRDARRPPPPSMMLLLLAPPAEEEEASIKDKDKLRPARAAAEVTAAVISSGLSNTPSPGSYTTTSIPPEGFNTSDTLSARRMKLSAEKKRGAGPNQTSRNMGATPMLFVLRCPE